MIIKLPGKPIAQARMRYTSIGGYGRAYDPCAKQKKAIRETLMSYKTDENFDFPSIAFLFFMPIPISTPKRIAQEYCHNMHRHVKKPDIDNLIKFYLDCLVGIIIDKDETVSLDTSLKIYSNEPCTWIIINEMQSLVHLEELPPIS